MPLTTTSRAKFTLQPLTKQSQTSVVSATKLVRTTLRHLQILSKIAQQSASNSPALLCYALVYKKRNFILQITLFFTPLPLPLFYTVISLTKTKERENLWVFFFTVNRH
jgi:hypothetical protein